MKEITAQIINKTLVPFTDDDKDILSEFKTNQIVRLKIQGTQKERSLQQLRMFCACAGKVAENTDDIHWNSREKVADQCKVGLNFIDINRTIVDTKGNVHFHYRSISFKNLKHLDACNFFDRAYPIMAGKLGITVEELQINSME